MRPQLKRRRRKPVFQSAIREVERRFPGPYQIAQPRISFEAETTTRMVAFCQIGRAHV